MKIILIGFMGSGKTSVGKKLAEMLNFEFVDMDEEIEKLEKKEVSEIFESFGENYFRNLEIEVLKSSLKKENCIISTGGGIILNNEQILQSEENVIFLDASIETIKRNLINEIHKRPLLKDLVLDGKIIEEAFNQKIKSMLDKRHKTYVECSNLSICVDEKTIYEISEEIKLKI